MTTAQNAVRGSLTRKGRARRVEIVDAASELFHRRGYHQVSMDDIAEEAGVAKATLYHYFSGKTKILYEIHHEFILPLLEAARARAEADVPASTELRQVARDVIGFFSRKAGHMRVFSEHLRDLDPEDRALVVAHRDEYRGLVEQAIRRGVERGEFWVADVRLSALTFLGAVNWAYNWFHPDGDRTADEVADALWDQLALGFASRGLPPQDRSWP